MKNNNMTLIGAAILIIVGSGAFFLLKGNGSSASAQQIELVTQPNPVQTVITLFT
jgi:hypothetical protein